jgi:hypothetical protein
MDWVIPLAVVIVVLGWRIYLTLSSAPKAARIWYLTKDRENYIRFRSNPGFTIGRFHRCRKGKMCSYRSKK